MENDHKGGFKARFSRVYLKKRVSGWSALTEFGNTVTVLLFWNISAHGFSNWETGPVRGSI